jgi:hypothetical protein
VHYHSWDFIKTDIEMRYDRPANAEGEAARPGGNWSGDNAKRVLRPIGVLFVFVCRGKEEYRPQHRQASQQE